MAHGSSPCLTRPQRHSPPSSVTEPTFKSASTTLSPSAILMLKSLFHHEQPRCRLRMQRPPQLSAINISKALPSMDVGVGRRGPGTESGSGGDLHQPLQTRDRGCAALADRPASCDRGRHCHQRFEPHVRAWTPEVHSYRLNAGPRAINACTIRSVQHGQTHLHLGRLLWLSTLIDAAIHREWLVAMGRRPALNQFAHLVCELFLRLQAVGLTQGMSFELPLTQAELGDVLGLSTVHVNRVIQQLRADGLVTWSEKRIVIADWSQLQEVAEFDPTFLNLENEPR
jgi:hypothetical protein